MCEMREIFLLHHRSKQEIQEHQISIFQYHFQRHSVRRERDLKKTKIVRSEKKLMIDFTENEIPLNNRRECSGNASALSPSSCGGGGERMVLTRVGCKISIMDLLVANMRAIALSRFIGNGHMKKMRKEEHPLTKDGMCTSISPCVQNYYLCVGLHRVMKPKLFDLSQIKIIFTIKSTIFNFFFLSRSLGVHPSWQYIPVG